MPKPLLAPTDEPKVGRRDTASRRALLGLIATMPPHFDVEQLCEACRQKKLPVSRATIYRTLPLLCSSGVLRSTEFGDGRHLYTHTRPDAVPTAEIYVVDCGRVIEVPAPFLTWYAQTVTAKAGYELLGQRLQTFAKCRERTEPNGCDSCSHTPAPPPAT